MTPYHAKYWATILDLSRPQGGVEGLSRSIANARVDLNPHQIDAAIFALRSPYTKGVLLADEVGLGKTIEAGLVLAQKWAERRRKILLIVPATLRKQWQNELESKFFLPSVILETKSFNDAKKAKANPLQPRDSIVIISYQFAYSKRADLASVPWDAVVVDEAHRLRNLHKKTKTVEGIVKAIEGRYKVLLTATPLQNSLLEMFSLVNILDPQLFGSEDAFTTQYVSNEDVEARNRELKDRLKGVCKRTLRRQIQEYVRYTARVAQTIDFIPSPQEEELYNKVSEYLQRDTIVALPKAQRQLITLILRKLLASSSAAIAATLKRIAGRLTSSSNPSTATSPQAQTPPLESELADDYEALDESTDEEEDEDESTEQALPAFTPEEVKAEISDLEGFVALANKIPRDAKADALVSALQKALDLAEQKGAARKAVVFTESCKTQEYLRGLLEGSGYAGKIVLMNGSNNDPSSQTIYANWKERHKDRPGTFSGSKTADMKAAIVEEFRDRATILLATESAAEGVNLQFCSLVVNYDLPWNPQRIEQRIGRCHRYGQKFDVVVVNFLNRKNAADVRVFELLSNKFALFEGVFGASDEVLGSVESGVDFEKKIAAIYQNCRTAAEIQAAFDDLQKQLEDSIQAKLADTRKVLLDNFDEEVHQRLAVHRDSAKAALDTQQQNLLDLARFELGDDATFAEGEARFTISRNTEVTYDLDWSRAEKTGAVFFRPGDALAQSLVEKALDRPTPQATLVFSFQPQQAALAPLIGQSGWLVARRLHVEALERTEEHLLVAACSDQGTPIAPDIASKLFSLEATVSMDSEAPIPAPLLQVAAELQKTQVQDVRQRNEQFFEEETTKVEEQTEDLKLGLEREVKKLDKEITAARKVVHKATTLADKIKAKQAVAALETKRNQKLQLLFQEQDRLNKEMSKLIEGMKQNLDNLAIKVEDVFAVRWTLVNDPTTQDLHPLPDPHDQQEAAPGTHLDRQERAPPAGAADPSRRSRAVLPRPQARLRE